MQPPPLPSAAEDADDGGGEAGHHQHLQQQQQPPPPPPPTTTDTTTDEADGTTSATHIHLNGFGEHDAEPEAAAAAAAAAAMMHNGNGHVHVPPPPQQQMYNSNEVPPEGVVLHHHHNMPPPPPYNHGQDSPLVHSAAASTVDSTDNSGSNAESEEDPLKLFVGQVPKQMSEEDIFPTFDNFGPLKDVAIIRDKHTGLHRGCAFVTYWNSSDAQRAQQALHDTFTFPGARRPAQVKPAEPSAVPENKLFIGMLPRTATEDDVRELFQTYGEIREIHMIRSSDGTSRCAAFLRYVKRESALAAMENLNGNIVMDGAARPLIVKFADNKHQRHQRHLRNIRKQEMLSAAGSVPPYPYPPQGAGGPQMPMPPPSAGGPPYSMPHHPGSHQFPPPYGAGPPYMYPPAYMPYGPPGHHPGHHPQHQQSQGDPNASPGGNNSNPRPREGPAGANLFVYHLPHDLTDADLATAFNSFGNVISAKVYVDKYTGESKGFGFVSYDSVISAEAAIEQMNGFQIGNKRLKVQHKRVHGINPNLPVHRSDLASAS